MPLLFYPISPHALETKYKESFLTHKTYLNPCHTCKTILIFPEHPKNLIPKNSNYFRKLNNQNIKNKIRTS